MTKGSYALVLRLGRPCSLTIGKLGRFDFPGGHYLYFGSAQRGLEGRIRRHLRTDKKRHWHIDYLTAVAPVVEVWWAEGPKRMECRWAQTAAALPCAVVPAPGFGSSDCSCRSHLVRLPGGSLDVARKRVLGGHGERLRGEALRRLAAGQAVS